MNLNYKRSSLLGLNERDLKTRIRIINSFKLSDEAFLKKYYCDRDTLFNICLPSYKKILREKSDIKFISLYLANIKKFMSLIKNYNEENTNNTSLKEKTEQKTKSLKLLKYISANIIYESFPNKRLIMRFGDSGDRFYIILYGVVSILIPVKTSLKLSFYEYSQYIATLLLYREFEIAKLVIRENKHIYGIDLPDMKYIINFFNKNSEEEENKIIYKNGFYRTLRGLKSEKTIKIIKKLDHKMTINLKENDQEDSKEEQAQKIIKFMKLFLPPEQFKLFIEAKNEKIELEKDNGIELSSEAYINRLKSYKFNKNNNNNFIIKKEKINKKNFTSRRQTKSKTSIHHDFESQNERNKNNSNNSFFFNNNKASVYIYEYQEIIQLETGDMFGDMALSNSNAKRTATIISASDCHFGCLNKDMFNYVKFSNDKNRKNIINYISRTRIFKSLKYKAIEEKYINYFAFKNCVKDEFLIKIGEINNNIIIIKNGKFEINVKGEIQSFYDLINQYKINHLNSDDISMSDNIMRKINKVNLNRNKIEKLFKNNFNDNTCKLFVINSSAIFGFKETEKKNFESFFEIKCASSEGEYVLLDKIIFYRQMYLTDFKVKEETHLCIKEFIDRTIDRLIYVLYSNIYHTLTKNNLKLFKNVKIISNIIDNDYMNKYNLTDIEYIIDTIFSKYTEQDFDTENGNINIFNKNDIKQGKGKNTIILEEEKNNIANSSSIFKYLRNKKRINSLKFASIGKSAKNLINKNITYGKKISDNKIDRLFNQCSDKRNNKFDHLKYRKLKIKTWKNSSFSEEKKINFINSNKNRNRKKINNFMNNITSKTGRNKSISSYIFGKTSDTYISDVNINCDYTHLNNAHISKLNYSFKINNSMNQFETPKTNMRQNSTIYKYLDLTMKKILGGRESYGFELNRCFSTKHNSAINLFDSNQINKDSYSEKRQKYLLKYARDIWTRNRPIVLYKRRKKIEKEP